MADEARGLFAIQFHPEVNHTQRGRELIAHFVHRVCGCGADWTPAGIIESPFFAYDRRYLVAGVLTPGQAYWVRAGREGVLHLR